MPPAFRLSGSLDGPAGDLGYTKADPEYGSSPVYSQCELELARSKRTGWLMALTGLAWSAASWGGFYQLDNVSRKRDAEPENSLLAAGSNLAILGGMLGGPLATVLGVAKIVKASGDNNGCPQMPAEVADDVPVVGNVVPS